MPRVPHLNLGVVEALLALSIRIILRNRAGPSKTWTLPSFEGGQSYPSVRALSLEFLQKSAKLNTILSNTPPAPSRIQTGIHLRIRIERNWKVLDFNHGAQLGSELETLIPSFHQTSNHWQWLRGGVKPAKSSAELNWQLTAVIIQKRRKTPSLKCTFNCEFTWHIGEDI